MFGNALVTQGRQRRLLVVSTSVLVVNGLVNLVAIPLLGARGAAGTLVLSEVLSLILTLGVYRRVAPLPALHMPMRSLLALAALIVGSSVRFVFHDATLAIAAALIVGLAAYLVALQLLHVLPTYMSRPLLSAARAIRPRGAL